MWGAHYFVALLTMIGKAAATTTCGDLRETYRTEECCGNPAKEVAMSTPAPCPYSFDKPACDQAEPQAPRDLSTGAMGDMTPKAATLNDAQAAFLPLVNVHFHLGAEHKSDDYADETDANAFDAHKRRMAKGRQLSDAAVRPGFMCSSAALTAEQLQPYSFQYCKGEMQVGKSYEIHYVHSSAGSGSVGTSGDTVVDEAMADGLGGAANGRGLLNPMVVVQGQVFQLVQGAASVDDMLHGWTVVGHENSVMYPGSTTGPSHDNNVCSPYAITWHVDKDCHQVSPESFDNLCKQMNEMYGLANDQYPHGSRIILDPAYVVQSQYVQPLA